MKSGSRKKRYFIRGVLIFTSIVITLSGISQGLMNLQFRQSDRKIMHYFTQSPVKPTIYFAACDDRMVRVIELFNSDTLPNLVFVHGAPGSSNDFIRYMADSALQRRFNMITYDRPGYGYSGFGNSMTSLQKQALVIHEITHHLSNQTYLVGHSYGGPIALRYAMDYPQDYAGLLLLAPANDPSHELIFKIAYLGKWPPFRWLTPTAMKVAADEKFSHVKELEAMMPLYPLIDKKVVYIQGTKDSLVPFANLKFTESQLINADFEKIVIEDEDHFIPWTQYDLIKENMLKFTR